MPNNNQQQPVMLVSGSPETENRASSLYPGQLGSRFTIIVGGVAKRYQVVQMDSAVDVAASEGAVAWWRNATGYVVTTDVSVAGRGKVAGVFRCLVDVTNVGCIQIGGPSTVQSQTSPTSPADDTGKIVVPSATDAKADILGAGTAASYPSMGTTTGWVSSGLFPAMLNLAGRE